MNEMMEAFSEPQTSGFMRIVYDTFLVVVATTKHLFSAGKCCREQGNERAKGTFVELSTCP